MGDHCSNWEITAETDDQYKYLATSMAFPRPIVFSSNHKGSRRDHFGQIAATQPQGVQYDHTSAATLSQVLPNDHTWVFYTTIQGAFTRSYIQKRNHGRPVNTRVLDLVSMQSQTWSTTAYNNIRNRCDTHGISKQVSLHFEFIYEFEFNYLL